MPHPPDSAKNTKTHDFDHVRPGQVGVEVMFTMAKYMGGVDPQAHI